MVSYQLRQPSVLPVPSSRQSGYDLSFPVMTNSRFTSIQDTMANQDYVELGRSCADVCQVLNRGLSGKNLDKLPQSVLDAIEQFTK